MSTPPYPPPSPYPGGPHPAHGAQGTPSPPYQPSMPYPSSVPYQPPVPHQSYPPPYAGAPIPGPGPAPVCDVCGAAPAAPVTMRGHQGLVVLMRFLRREGTFCRTCALAVFRDMQINTLMQGWWSPLSVLITPVVLLLNLGSLSGVRRMPVPTAIGWRAPLDPGKPILKRPIGLVLMAPLAALLLVVVAVPVLVVIGLVAGDGQPTPLKAGSCARNDGSWSEQDLTTVPCGSSDAQFRVTEPGGDGCPAGDFIADLTYSEDGATSLCLHPLNG